MSDTDSTRQDGGYWVTGKPLHGWTCTCGAADCQEPNREFVPYGEDP